MSPRTLSLSDDLHDYLIAHSLRESDVQRRLRQETQALGGDGAMQIAPEQGQFMALLARLMGARRAIEVGTFTGYSALAVAQALPADGLLVACDVSAEWTAIGRRYWQEAGVADRIELRLGPGLETLAELRVAGWSGTVDLMFVDADKPAYPAYFEAGLELLRPGGLLMVDNVLWGGSVADPTDQTKSTRAIRDFNTKAHRDERVDVSLVPIGDGLTLIRKR